MGMVIGLNAGHTLKGPGCGAVGLLNESNETRAIVRELGPMLTKMGCTVVPCTIDSAATQAAYLKQAMDLANKKSLNWFISIHLNNDAAKAGKGVEAYTYDGRQYADAVEVCQNIANLGFKNRGVKAGSGLYVIRKSKAKAILIEVCFVNNPDASQYAAVTPIRIAQAIASALVDYVAPSTMNPITIPDTSIIQYKRYVKVLYAGTDGLAIRTKADWNAKATKYVHKNEMFTVVQKVDAANGDTDMYEIQYGQYITASPKYVTIIEK